MLRLPRRKLRAGGCKGTPAQHPSTPTRSSRTSADISPPMGGSKSRGRWRSAPEVEDLGGIIGTREQVLAAIQLQRWRRRPGCPRHAQSWDAASDDHEVHGLAAEAWQATAEGTTNEDQLHDPARGQSQHERRQGLPTQREAEGEGERVPEREGSSRELECGSSECDEMGSGLSTPSTADAAQSTPTTPPMRSRPDLSPACTAGGAAESYTMIPSPHPTDSHPTASYHSERCAESGKLRSLCACAACTAPQAAARREHNNQRCAAA
jgi:hypothetical protein